MTASKEYGLLIRKEIKHGCNYVVAYVVSKENNAPIGCGSSDMWDAPKPHAGRDYDRLGMWGFVSDMNDHAYIGFEAEYRDTFSVDFRKATRMHKTLATLDKKINAADTREAGDYLAAMCKALSLSFVVEQMDNLTNANYADSKWRFMSVNDGRNRFRTMIEDTRRKLKGE